MSVRDAFVPVWLKRSSKLERASSLLEPVIKKLGIANGVRLSRIKNDWNLIFEKPLSLHMWPSKLAEGGLLLNVDSSIWIHQLGYHKSAILSKLAPYGIKDVRFRVGGISRKEEKEEVRAPAELSGQDRAFVSELVSDINDLTLRDLIRSAAEKSLLAERKNNGE
jgi:Dna[CI] antecedent, DciA